MPYDFVPGWSPEAAEGAAAILRSTPLAMQAPAFSADAPIPPAFSLSKHRLRHLEQAGVGTCWMHAPVQAAEIMTSAAGKYRPVALSRCMVGYRGVQLWRSNYGGPLRNPADGGSVTLALMGMADAASGGIGACHESIWPYLSDELAKGTLYQDRASVVAAYRYLAQGPPAGALADGDHDRVTGVASLPLGDGSDWKRSLNAGIPIATGFPWSGAWDREGATFFSGRPGWPKGGHAQLVIGYMEHEGSTFWQHDNWHGLLYKPLPADLAAGVPGYKPITADRTSDYWVEHSCLQAAFGDQPETVIARTVGGFDLVSVPWTPGGFA